MHNLAALHRTLHATCDPDSPDFGDRNAMLVEAIVAVDQQVARDLVFQSGHRVAVALALVA